LNTCINGTQTQFLIIDGLSNRSADSEGRDDHALQATPWQQSLFAFDPTRAQRPKHTHLVAVDLSRFGQAPGPRSSRLTSIQAVCAALTSAVAGRRFPSGWVTDESAALATRWWERRWHQMPHFAVLRRVRAFCGAKAW
jgi:hypothetical protein